MRKPAFQILGRVAILAAAVLLPAAAYADDPVDLLDPPPAADDPSPATRPDAEPALTIAAVLPQTGTLAPFGLSARLGIELAVARVNRDGGIAGRPVRLIVSDNQSQKRRVPTAVGHILRDTRPDVLIGGLTGPNAAALQELADRRDIPALVLAGAFRPGDDQASQAVRVSVSTGEMVDALARFAVEQMQAKSAWVIARVGDDHPAIGADRFASQFVKLGGKLAGFTSVDGNDPPDLADRVAEATPDLVYIDASPARLAELAAAVHAKLPDVPILSTGRFYHVPEILKPQAAGVRPGYVAVEFAAADSPKLVEFAESLAKARAGARPDAIAVLAYDSVLLAVEAARRRADGNKPLLESLLAIRAMPGLLGPVGFDDAGQVVRPVTVCRLVPVSDAGEGPIASRLEIVNHVWPNGGPPAADNKDQPPADDNGNR